MILKAPMTPKPRPIRISEQLGMSHGAACGKLRKSLLFKLVQQVGEDRCFKCGEKILTDDDLSIEHKLPWEGRDANLFWDLENVTFSHRKCNRPHTNNGTPGPHITQRKIVAEGYAWCCGCQAELPIECFGKHSREWNGLQGSCVVCKRIYRAGQVL